MLHPAIKATAAVGGLGLALWSALRPARVVVTGSSMAPTFAPGDRLLSLRAVRLVVGDVVVVPDPRDEGRWLVKRVAGLDGRRVGLTGDNPSASTDSRTFGDVARRAVRGRVVYRYFPPDAVGRPPGPPSQR